MIDGVEIIPLRQIPDERGKAWHLHERMTINYAVPHGRIKLVVYDDREGSPTKGELEEIVLGEANYSLVTVPPFVWNGFKGIGEHAAIVANCATIPHDPGEIVRLDPFSDKIPYDWAIKHG